MEEWSSVGFENVFFSLNDIVLEYSGTSSVRYCLKDGVLFKCLGGFRNFKNNCFVPKNFFVVRYVNQQASVEVKCLARVLNIPIVHNRQVGKFR